MAKPRVHRTALPVKDIEAAAKFGWSFETNQYFYLSAADLDDMRRKVRVRRVTAASRTPASNRSTGSSSARAQI